ncbi:hypothetical protein M9434_004407 [Picochlorum sp. BPE23]|nr:hypothetical protein M9434_004407 [Picochlorum sp. BPE23]
MATLPGNAIVAPLCLLLLGVFVESNVTAQKGSSSRETLISGVCEGISSSEYQSYVNYNIGKTYYRDGDIVGIYTLTSGSRSLAKCGQACVMDWEQNGDSQNIINGDFTGTQSCEAFVFNPKTAKCILLSGLSELNLRESTRYYSGYLECPEPEETFNSSIIQPPANVNVVLNCTEQSFTVSWDSIASATGYLINCIRDGSADPVSGSAIAGETSLTITSIASNYVPNDNYTCYVSSYTYTALSKGSPSNAFTTCP